MKRLKEFFGAMKDFFRHPVIGIDRILSSGIKWQLLFLLGVIVAAILLFIVIEWLTGSILTIKENDPRNIFVDVYYLVRSRGLGDVYKRQFLLLRRTTHVIFLSMSTIILPIPAISMSSKGRGIVSLHSLFRSPGLHLSLIHI